jgi:hypothetical protein
MTESTFAKQLADLAPRKYKIVDNGLPMEFIDEFIKSYVCIEKVASTLNNDVKDVLLRLLTKYDCSKVQIGQITFLKDIEEYNDFYVVGNIEQDLLVISKLTRNVEVVDFFKNDHIIWKCAIDSDHFLKAMLIAASLFTSAIEDYSLSDDNSYLLGFLNKSVAEAGGLEYYAFFRMLIGYNPI